MVKPDQSTDHTTNNCCVRVCVTLEFDTLFYGPIVYLFDRFILCTHQGVHRKHESMFHEAHLVVYRVVFVTEEVLLIGW